MTINIRHRSRGSFISSSRATLWSAPGPGVCNTVEIPYTTIPGCLVGTIEIMDDVVTPNFKARQAKGEMLFNPMRHQRLTSSLDLAGDGPAWRQLSPSCNPTGLPGDEVYGTGRWEGPMLANLLTGGNQPLPAPSGIISDDDIRRLEIEISTAVIAARGMSSQNLWEDAVEFKKTVALFSGPIRYLHSFFRKNGKAMALMGPAEAWLAYRYGVRPFVEDVSTVINGLDMPVGIRRDTTRKSETIREQSVSTVSVGDSAAGHLVSCLTTDNVTVRGMSIDEHASKLRDNIGFSTKGLLTVPWDLIPFSFVLDWFVSVGDYLKAFAPTPGYKTIGGCVTTTREISSLWTPFKTELTPALAGNILTAPLTGACSATNWVKLRAPLSAPGIVFRSNFRFSSLTRVADSIALLSQVARRFFS